MYEAASFDEITAEMQAAIAEAARQVGARTGDMEGYFLAGDKWQADTLEGLTELLVECWKEQEDQS